MIRKIQSGGAMAFFGNGTVRVRPYTLKTRYGGQVELTECRPRAIGGAVDKEDVVYNSNKIVLNFESVDSLDVLIEKLQDLREDLANETKV
jgi:hypothetical protein